TASIISRDTSSCCSAIPEARGDDPLDGAGRGSDHRLRAQRARKPEDRPMSERSKVRTCLWFDHQGEEAAGFYVSLLPNSRIENIFRPDPDGPALVVNFILAGAPYMALNGEIGRAHV